MSRSLTATTVIVALALLACKMGQNETKQEAAPVPTPVAAPVPTPEPVKEEPITDFRGKYVTSYGVASCTQVKRNVNCLYRGQAGSADCKVTEDDELDCTWEEDGEGSGLAHLKRKENGDLTGTWGFGESKKNGGQWYFKKKADE